MPGLFAEREPLLGLSAGGALLSSPNYCYFNSTTPLLNLQQVVWTAIETTVRRSDVGRNGHARAQLTQLWLLWKQASELVRTAVVSDVTASTNVSEAELTVLIHLQNLGGTMRQNALVASTGWNGSRLSHVLTRMEAAALVGRNKLKNGVEVTIEPTGQLILDEAGDTLQSAVQNHFGAALSPGQLGALERMLTAVVELNTEPQT